MAKEFKYELPDWYKKYNSSGIEFPEKVQNDSFEECCERFKNIELEDIIKEYYYKPISGLMNLVAGTTKIKTDDLDQEDFADYINVTYDIGNILLENLE